MGRNRRNKYKEVMGYREANGAPCPYCQRSMDVRSPKLMPTRDHTIPKSKGGRHTIWACYECNHAKGDMDLDKWLAFVEAYPEWWKGLPKMVLDSYRPGALAVIPIAESKMILRHGKKYWRQWKLSGAHSCNCCQ